MYGVKHGLSTIYFRESVEVVSGGVGGRGNRMGKTDNEEV